MLSPLDKQEVFIRKLYEESYEQLRYSCRVKLHFSNAYEELIHECLQQTFMLAKENYYTLRDHPNPKAWLYKTCYNRLIPYAKIQREHEKRIAYSLDDASVRCDIYTADVADLVADNDVVKRMLNELQGELSATERKVYDLHFKKGDSIEEVVTALHIEKGNAKVVISNIRKKARAIAKKFPSHFLFFLLLFWFSLTVYK